CPRRSSTPTDGSASWTRKNDGAERRRPAAYHAGKEVSAMYDMSNMKKLKRLGELAPAAWQGVQAFDKAAMADGAIPARTKELIALAVAVTTQCPYCIQVHTQKAKSAGCSEAEIAEAVLVAAALRSGGAVTHGTHALE